MARRRRFRLGIRGRVLGLCAALLIAASATGLLAQRTVLLRRLDRDAAASLERERLELEALAAGRDPDTGQPFAGDVRAIFDTFLRRNVPGEGQVYVAFVDGAPYQTTPAPRGVRLDRDSQLASRWSTLTAGEAGSLSTDAGPIEYLAVPLRSQGRTAGVFVVAYFLRGERQEIEDNVRVEAGVFAVVLLVAFGAAWVLAGRLLRPVQKLTATARAISDTDLARRIPVEGDSEIGELARTFNEMLDRLEAAFTAQRAFVDDAGHELRTPITIVRGHLELMSDDPDDRQATIALVTDELDRMARVVDDLLLLAKAEQPDFVQLEPVELSDLTTDLLIKARVLGDRDWRLDACASGPVRADPQRVAQAVLNLARNAVEHTTPGAEIAVGSDRRDGEVRMWVRDTGAGVDPAEHDRIFDRFARGGAGPRRSDGAGLGLAIVQAVATAHQGRVELVSGLGVGATFTLVIPDSSPSGTAELDPTGETAVSGDDSPPLDAVDETDPARHADVTREVDVAERTVDATERATRWSGS